MKTPLLILSTSLLTLVASPAAVFLNESFEYGSTAGALAGYNGGNGFSAGWTGSSLFTYDPNGLTLGSYPSTGGKAKISLAGQPSAFTAYRTLSSSLSGTVYGSFLVNLEARSGSGALRTAQGAFFGKAGDTDNTSSIALQTDEFNSNNAALRVEGSSTVLGVALNIGETYMFAFRTDFDPTVQTAKAWVLSAAQYTFLSANNLFNEAGLDGLSVGTAENQLWGSGATTRTATLDTPINTLGFLSYVGDVGGVSATTSIDEFRMTTTFEGINTIPEASTATLGLFGMGLLSRRRRG